MSMGPLKGPFKKKGGMNGVTKQGKGQKNVNSRRRNKSSNAGKSTSPIKGMDKGTG